MHKFVRDAAETNDHMNEKASFVTTMLTLAKATCMYVLIIPHYTRKYMYMLSSSTKSLLPYSIIAFLTTIVCIHVHTYNLLTKSIVLFMY